MAALDAKSQWDSVAGYPAIKARLDAICQQRLSAAPLAHQGMPHGAGLLLEGLPGCGKSLIAGAIVGSGGRVVVPADIRGATPEISAANLRSVFDHAAATAPSVLVLDDLDILVQGDSEVSWRIATDLRALLDRAPRLGVFVIGCVRLASALPNGLGRAGRFDHALSLMPPSPSDRRAIVKHHIRAHAALDLGRTVDLGAFSASTPLTSGADLAAMIRTAAHAAMDTGNPRVVIEHDHLRYARSHHRRSLSLSDIQDWLSQVRQMPGNGDGVMALERDIEAFESGRSELIAMDVSHLLPDLEGTPFPPPDAPNAAIRTDSAPLQAPAPLADIALGEVFSEPGSSPKTDPATAAVAPDPEPRIRATQVYEVRPDPRWDPTPRRHGSADDV